MGLRKKTCLTCGLASRSLVLYRSRCFDCNQSVMDRIGKNKNCRCCGEKLDPGENCSSYEAWRRGYCTFCYRSPIGHLHEEQGVSDEEFEAYRAKLLEVS